MDDATLDTWIEIGTANLGIRLKPDWQEAVRMHLRISLTHAAALLDAKLPDALDPAPVFKS